MNSMSRIHNLQKKLINNNIDGLLLSGNSSFHYLIDKTDSWWQRTSDNNIPVTIPGLPCHYSKNVPDAIIYIPAHGDAVIVATPQKAFELGACCVHVLVGYIFEFSKLVSKYIKGEKIAIGLSCDIHLTNIVQTINPAADITKGEHLVEELRLIKDKKEIATMKDIAKFTDNALTSVVPMLIPGVTSEEIQEYLINIGKNHNMLDLPFPATAHFEKGSTPYGSYYKKNTPLEAQSTIAFDFGYMLEGYCSDFGRSFYCGKAPQVVKDAHAALNNAQENLINNIVPFETNMKDMYATIEKSVIKDGMEKHLTNFANIGMLGHQIGIDVHETPWIHINQDTKLKPGMIMCIEPKMVIENEGFLRVEDMVLITDTGAESITKFDRKLFELI